MKNIIISGCNGKMGHVIASCILDRNDCQTVAEVENVITDAAGKLLRKVRLFDVYKGIGIPDGKKSLAFSLELRADDRTLTDEDSENVMHRILTSLSEKLGAVLR